MFATPIPRRHFLRTATLAAAGARSFPAFAEEARKPRALFDGTSLAGWHAVPRLPVPKEPRFAQMPAAGLREAVVRWYEGNPQGRERLAHSGVWTVKEGAIIGRQEEGSRQGAYLLSDETFADFELTLEARPDWPVDTGIMVRAHEVGNAGFQVLVDHRPKGGMGGVFGNSIGNFLAAPFALDGDKAEKLRVANLRAGVVEANFAHPRMNHAASFADFAKVWRANDWNEFRIRCIGPLPVITTWINGLKICELDTAKIDTPGYDPEAVATRLGWRGHIGFEIHDIGPKDPLGDDRWTPGGACRWRNITIQEL